MCTDSSSTLEGAINAVYVTWVQSWSLMVSQYQIQYNECLISIFKKIFSHYRYSTLFDSNDPHYRTINNVKLKMVQKCQKCV